ncbi:MAG: hypothetical protein ACLVJU_12040 [Blautia sp.]
MQRGFTIQSKVDGLVLDGLVVEPEEGVTADGASAAQPWNERVQGAVSAVYGVYGGTRCSVCDS